MSDRYAKIVLTVIAVCLLKIAFGDLIAPAEAQSKPQKVAICNEDGVGCTKVVPEYTGGVSNADGGWGLMHRGINAQPW